MKPNSFIRLKCNSDSFYRMWVEFLTPFHKLTPREKDVMARIIAQYYHFQESVDDPVVLKDVLWSRTSRKDMMESLGMSQAHFQMALGKLRANGVLIDGDINKKYLPHMGEDPRFVLQVVFDWSSPTNPIRHVEQN